MNNKTLFIGGLVVAVFGLAGLVWWLHKEGIFTSFRGKKTTDTTTPATNSVAVPTDAFPLRRGSKGANVRRLQSALNSAIVFLMPARPFLYNGRQRTSIAVDGVWGNETQAAVNWYYMLNKVEITEAELSQIKGV